MSNPGKVYFPERDITKLQVVDYYLAVAGVLIGVLAYRPVTLKRFVDDVAAEPFYAERIPRGAPPWVDSIEITFLSDRKACEVCPNRHRARTARRAG